MDVPTVNVIDITDYPQIFYSASIQSDIIDQGLAGTPLPCGQYAFGQARGDLFYLARDPVGCNKLFFGHDRSSVLILANRIDQAWNQGVSLSAIASCPPGRVLELSAKGVRVVGGTDISETPAGTDFSIATLQQRVRERLDNAFGWLAHEFEGRRIVVCLSGGLDSSIVASFAAAHFPSVTAFNFTYLGADDVKAHALGAPLEDLRTVSEDFRAAAAVARALGVPFLPVTRPKEAVAPAIPASVRLGQDWRDFNVHCATVNLFLAQDIDAAFPGEKAVVLTGDLMNEYLCDYKEERVGNAVYYKIPRIPLANRRKYFVRGLDAGDREIGVFGAHGLTACQPFAVLADLYMNIPADILDQPDIKWKLNGPLLTGSAAPHVNRSKTRAQVGGQDQGTLAAYHQLGADDQHLRRLWQQQFPGEATSSCDGLIQFGRYRLPQYTAG